MANAMVFFCVQGAFYSAIAHLSNAEMSRKVYYPTENPERVTEKFGWRIHPVTGKKNYHSAIDYGQRGTSGRVYAVTDGVITKIGQTSKGTDYFIVKNSNGIRFGYYHSETTLPEFSKVSAGQYIGISNMSGYSTGLHLHFTIQTGSSYDTRIDPLNWFKQYSPITPVK